MGFCFERNIKWAGSPLLGLISGRSLGRDMQMQPSWLRPPQSCSCRVELTRPTVDRGIWALTATPALVFCYCCPVALSFLFTFSSVCLSLSRVSGKVGRMVPEQQMFRLQHFLPANNWNQCSRETLWDSARKTSNTSQPPDSAAQLTLLFSPRLLILTSFCFLYTFSVFLHFKCFCQPLLCCLKMRGIFTCGGLLLVTLLLTSVDAKGTLYGSPYRYNLHKSGSVPQYNPGKPLGHHK